MSNDRNNDNYGNSHGGQHEQRANKGNSWDDDNLSAHGNNGKEMNASDNDDFNNQGWPEDDERNAQSRTYNEDEDTYEDEQRTANSGTQNNNWDANNQTQRTSHIHDDEQWDKNEPYDSGSGL